MAKKYNKFPTLRGERERITKRSVFFLRADPVFLAMIACMSFRFKKVNIPWNLYFNYFETKSKAR